MRETITVGNTSLILETIPVKLLLDFYDDTPSDTKKSGELFRMIEIDGMFVVSVETFYHLGSVDIDYKSFLTIDDGYEYLEMYGVMRDEKEQDCNSEI